MRQICFTMVCLFTAVNCEAGYIEYQFLAESSCDAFSVTTDAVPPAANAPDASPEYKAYMSRPNRGPGDIWALTGDSVSGTRWVDCSASENEIACTVIGGFRYQSFKCKLGQSTEWSRSCATPGESLGRLRIYSVDTSEYELGGNPIQNRYFQADLVKFGERCKKHNGKK